MDSAEDILGGFESRCACRALATRVYPRSGRSVCEACHADHAERCARAETRVESMIDREARATRVGSFLFLP